MLALVTGGEVHVKFSRLSAEQFCRELKEGGAFESAVGHEGTAVLLSQLCDVQIPANRVQIKLSDGDIAYVVTVGVRLPEGKVLTQEELKQYLLADQIAFWKVEIL